MRPHSLTRRISISFGLLSACVLLALGGFLYRSLYEHVQQSDTAEVAGKVQLVRYVLSGFASAEDISRNPQRMQQVLIGHPDLIVRMQDASGRTLFSSTEELLVQPIRGGALNADVLASEVATWSAESGRQYRVASISAKVGYQPGKEVIVLLGLDVSDHFRILRRYLQTTIAALAGALLAATLLGWWIARRELRVVRKIAATSRTVSSSHLGARLDVKDAPTELDDLVAAFNEMLAGLEESFGRLSQFSQDLAHEIRTPIHNLMIQTHVALSSQRTAAEYRQALEANTEEFERLARMVEDMLFLAKADRAQTVLERESCDMRREIEKVSAYFEPLAEEQGVRIECEGHAVMLADRRLVERVIANLLSNAIRHSDRGSVVHAAVALENSSVDLKVTNSGPGISEDLQDRVFDRFFQVNPSRSQSGAGWGLGLAIVKSIMALHDGSVGVRSKPEGPTTFTARFPAHDASRDM